MGEIWIPEAARLGDGSIGGAMDTPSAPARAVWHTTESRAGDASFKSVGKYLIDEASEPHILYDPTTDRLAQYGPLNQSARALKNDGSLRTNRTGAACIQIEVLARAGKPFTEYWRPGPNFKALMRAIRSWGVPDVWPAGELAKSYSDQSNRSAATWTSKGGHYGHSNAPGNDHWDPGNINRVALLAAGGSAPKPPAPQPSKPSVSLAHVLAASRRDPGLPQGGTTYATEVRLVEGALRAEGLLSAKYATDGSFGSLTRTAYAGWQRRLGYSGSDADGYPGKTSLTKLGSKYGFTVAG
ncbi:peptidoglycan-binding protein LysM [Streptomyces sp. H27-H1]|uniref:peptidoglycan-binding protein LysM n=1 Tax=Streptomyces sp. H27-H1 TaxID=2996461 RepID=UPI00226FEF87|nr:peptidoglycan-binding protein LysM [Streptomyces sp. H27-H1]MCY0926223.1 peptidoglycan-binding protein LysM [Streptomyces sp. H27-H1]